MESGALAKDEKIGDLLRLNQAPLARLRVLFQPCGEGLQRALHEQLVALGKPPFGGQIHEKFLDILRHDRRQSPAFPRSRQDGFRRATAKTHDLRPGENLFALDAACQGVDKEGSLLWPLTTARI